MNNQINHLDEETLLWSLIDKDSIEKDHLKHLKECTECQQKQVDLNHELKRFGCLAREFSPTPRRSLRPVSIVTNHRFVFFQLKNAFVYTLMVMICIGGVLGLWPTQTKHPDELAIKEATQQIEDILIQESTWKEQNYSILPDAFQYMIVDEFDMMSIPFYDYVFPINIPDNKNQDQLDEQTKRFYQQLNLLS
jgi:hypothetical protein